MPIRRKQAIRGGKKLGSMVRKGRTLPKPKLRRRPRKASGAAVTQKELAVMKKRIAKPRKVMKKRKVSTARKVARGITTLRARARSIKKLKK